jgi:hypothetical protein
VGAFQAACGVLRVAGKKIFRATARGKFSGYFPVIFLDNLM